MNHGIMLYKITPCWEKKKIVDHLPYKSLWISCNYSNNNTLDEAHEYKAVIFLTQFFNTFLKITNHLVTNQIWDFNCAVG